VPPHSLPCRRPRAGRATTDDQNIRLQILLRPLVSYARYDFSSRL
jgi:hypothetical protein